MATDKLSTLSVRKQVPAVVAAITACPSIKAVSLQQVFAPSMAKTQQELLTESGRPDQVQLNMATFLIRHDHAIIEDLESNTGSTYRRVLDAVNRCKPVKDLVNARKAAQVAAVELAQLSPEDQAAAAVA